MVNLEVNVGFNFVLVKRIGPPSKRCALYHIHEYVQWLYCCVILHNILAEIGNMWDKLYETCGTKCIIPLMEKLSV
ncbi:hypothetical protein VP01_219g6 [Puccinia sorghi]|uniref:DDE Tnp4 domain-containing protein n=1 Tax=Puccinia sorghi TaxID=27349 RepID=A0A0L6VAU5_9BASI|nr:hypothetical protein VP01_219g6 [Puccinia sorghi]